MSIKITDADRFVIFDIDNCVADDGWRIPLIKWGEQDMDKRYEDYHRAAIADRAGNMELFTRETRSGINGGLIPIFLTARPVRYAAATEAWLREKLGVDRHILICRNNADHRSSVAVKRSMIEGLWQYDVRLDCVVRAYDDRADICAMYREFGIEAHQAIIHDVCAMTPPKSRTKAPPHSPVADLLGEMAATFRERNAVYKDNFKTAGAVLRALYPDGIPPQLMGDELHLLMLIVVKLSRFVHSNHTHSDSMVDTGVYSAMIANILKENQQ